MTTPRIPVLYIAYWGAAEPLGQSLVLPAVELLATTAAITLVTYEKPSDLSDHAAIAAIRQRMERAGIRWIPLRYHKSPKVPATAFDILHGIVVGLRVSLRGRPRIIHGRTFIGALIGSIVSIVLRVPFVHHNEGFYPDEQVDGGVWRAGSVPHRVARFLERWMYGRANAIICMSRRSKDVLQKDHRAPVLVVPSCVDLSHFKLRAPARPHEPLQLIYIGSVGLRYIVDKLARFVAAAGQVAGGVNLRILSRAERSLVAVMMQSGGLSADQWSLDARSHAAIPAELAAADAGLFFLQQGISEFACSPTKIGEYWATGIPVVTTAGVSDTDDIIREHRVGVIVERHDDDAYRRAARELLDLLEDPDLASRCRLAAEKYYALAPFCEQQAALYAQLAGASA
jgi:glycosyltransferase involved in cell wall biosynthesis